MSELVDEALSCLVKDGRKIEWFDDREVSVKVRKRVSKKAAQDLRIPLRSAHRFSVTDEMLSFCQAMGRNLKESQFESLIENAAPPFECTVFENIPRPGVITLVERKRWNAMDMWFPLTQDHVSDEEEGVRPRPDVYQNWELFGNTFKGHRRTKQEEDIADMAVPNSAKHPVYYVQFIQLNKSTTTGKETHRYMEVEPFGFYFCPTGFLWRDKGNASREAAATAKARSNLVFGQDYMNQSLAQDVYSWPSHQRKVSLSSTHFLPMKIGWVDLNEFPSLQEEMRGDKTGSTYISPVEISFWMWRKYRYALEILSLLSTLNFDWVVDDAEPSNVGKRVKLEPDAPWNSHREIQINLPKDKGVEIALKKFYKPSPVGVRRHWVRAHNRVIRKNGVPVKVVRVGEHQRGDAKLGTVTHDYVLERDLKTGGK